MNLVAIIILGVVGFLWGTFAIFLYGMEEINVIQAVLAAPILVFYYIISKFSDLLIEADIYLIKLVLPSWYESLMKGVRKENDEE